MGEGRWWARGRWNEESSMGAHKNGSEKLY